jgi:hypothetical protein
MKYTVRKSIVRVLGRLWMPACLATTERELSSYDVTNASDDEGRLTRESVEDWLYKNAGDFSAIVDFSASLETAHGDTVDIEWESEENECAFCDIMYPSED